MQAEELKKRTFKAWLKASAICIVASPAIFVAWDLFESPASLSRTYTTGQISLFLAIAGIGAGVHFLAFLLIGLPIFFRFYSRPKSALWRWLPGIITGMVIGGVTVPLVPFMLNNRPLTEGLLQTFLMGALYGGFTAWACLLNRPNVESSPQK